MNVSYVYFLLKQLQLRGGALVSIFFLWLGALVGGGMAFATQVILARTLNVENFGAFSAALAVVNLLTPLAGFGVAGYWLEAFGREGWGALRWLPGSFRFLALSASLVFFVILLWGYWGMHNYLTKSLLQTLAITVLGFASIDLGTVKYQLEDEHVRLALWQFTPHLLRFIGVSVVIGVFGTEYVTAEHAAIVYALVGVIMLLLGVNQILSMRQGKLALKGHGPIPTLQASISQTIPSEMDVAYAAWPFGVMGIAYTIFFQIDIILIKYLLDDSAAGLYSASFLLLTAVYMPPIVVYQKFLLPYLHRWAYHNPNKLYKMFHVGNVLMLFLGFVTMLLLLWIAPLLLPKLFGTRYEKSVSLLMILSMGVPFRFLAINAGTVLVTGGNMWRKVSTTGFAAILAIGFNLILIPIFGSNGAATAAVLREVLLSVLYIYNARVLWSLI